MYHMQNIICIYIYIIYSCYCLIMVHQISYVTFIELWDEMFFFGGEACLHSLNHITTASLVRVQPGLLGNHHLHIFSLFYFNLNNPNNSKQYHTSMESLCVGDVGEG